MHREEDVSAFILAGGKSSRMGRDKAFVEFDGRTLLEQALEVAGSVTAYVRIVGSRERFAAYAPIVEDVFRDCGPLGGIHAALRASSTELNLILAIDMPFVMPAFLQYLIEVARDAREAYVTVPRAAARWQPLCAVYRRGFATAAEKALKTGKYKIDALFDVASTRVVDQGELELAGFSEAMFRNLNTPEEVKMANRRG